MHLVDSEFSRSDLARGIMKDYMDYKKKIEEKYSCFMQIFIMWFGEDVYTGTKEEIMEGTDKKDWGKCEEDCDLIWQLSGICRYSQGDQENCDFCV